MILHFTLDFMFSNNKNLTIDLSNQILIPTYCYHPMLELVLGIKSHSQTFMTVTCTFFCTRTNLHTCFCKYFNTVKQSFAKTSFIKNFVIYPFPILAE